MAHAWTAKTVVLQAYFTCNNYCCAEAKPAESLTSLKQSKWIQKNHNQPKPFTQSAVTKNVTKIQSAGTEPNVTKNVTKSHMMLWHDQVRC